MLRGVELVVPTKEAGRGRPLRAVVVVKADAPTPLEGLLSRGMLLLTPAVFPMLPLRDWRLVDVGMEAEPLMVGLT